MARQKNNQIPFGELLLKARLEMNLSRAQLSKETGIAENSLIRYEKAGVEEDGQYPPSPKLAKLCFYLGISPLKAMFGCLSYDEYWEAMTDTSENWLMDHPDHEYLVDQWFLLNKENRKLAACLKLLLQPTPDPDSHAAQELNWLKQEATKIIEMQQAFDQKMMDHGYYDFQTPPTLAFPGKPESPAGKQKLVNNYADFVETHSEKSEQD